MDHQEAIEIRVTGHIGNNPLSPDNFDIRELKKLLDVIEDLLYPGQKAKRPTISYSVEDGSVRNIFRTTRQSAAAFLAVVTMVQQSGSLDGLELPTARALHEVQRSAVRNGFTYEFSAPTRPSPALVISKDTSFAVNEDLWVDAEFYFYGILVNAGGKDRTNIHLNTTDNGLLTIAADKAFLRELRENVLYKNFAVHALGRQNVVTGEIDTADLRLIDLTPFDPTYNQQYLDNLIKKATPKWADVTDSDKWLSEIRGTND